MSVDIHAEDRQHRRYRALARKHLPGWAVSIFAPALRDALTQVAWIRRTLRGAESGLPNRDGRVQYLKASERRYLARVDRIVRLCDYNIEMERMWSSLPSLQADDSAMVVMNAINEIVEKFEVLPKRTPSARKASLSSAAGVIGDLLSKIEEDPEVFDMANDTLDLYLWTRGLVKKPISSTASSAVAERATLVDLLKFFGARIDDLVVEKPPIAHPGRNDKGLQPYLIRELSKLMNMYFNKPMDSTVALLVSAILNLPDALSRDSVRPYTKGHGKISGRS